MTEKQIETAILDFLQYMPGFYWKNNSIGVYDPIKKVFRKPRNKHLINGVSDILGICQGRFIAIEVKAQKGRPSEAQKNFLNQINACGGVGFVARSIGEVRQNMREFWGEIHRH